ncbi:hypothetical protein HZH68_012582 [Vespula germanica]|uniref:Uncharacterized protein n=1 Tax=Vespula germanica TaxID=30212 RepID=A0A834MXZ8_VESGE|nr:hypothetical protein HZH68_012582 [Vespula germanica]
MIRQFTMASNGRRFYAEHFFFSNGMFQLLFCIQHNQNSKDQLICFFIITALVLPAIVHQIFQLLETLQSARNTIEYSIIIVGSLLILYLNFYVGQKLANQSNAVFEEMCEIPFYMLSIKAQKLLLFMITRSGKPCMLSIGGMFVASHEIFAGLMRKALSFAMVYYSVQ